MLISIIFILGYLIKLPKYATFVGTRNDKTITFINNCCNLSIGDKVYYQDKDTSQLVMGSITKINNEKIYVEMNNATNLPVILVLHYNKGETSLLEQLVRKVLKL